MNDELVEILSEKVHASWMQEKQRQGFHDHTYKPGGKADDGSRRCLQCYGPEDRHHSDMLPYADLAEHIKDYDRVTVRGVLAGLDAAGYVVVTNARLSELQEAVALLNSMVICGEEHSSVSRAVVRAAFAAPSEERAL